MTFSPRGRCIKILGARDGGIARGENCAFVIWAPIYVSRAPDTQATFSQWAGKVGLLPLRKMFFERKRSRTKLSDEYGPWVKKDQNQNPGTVLVLSTASKPNKKRQVLLETLNESDNGRCTLNSWGRRESMVRVDESGENGRQWSGRGLNPQFLSRAASVSNGKTKSTCSSRKTFKLHINK